MFQLGEKTFEKIANPLCGVGCTHLRYFAEGTFFGTNLAKISYWFIFSSRTRKLIGKTLNKMCHWSKMKKCYTFYDICNLKRENFNSREVINKNQPENYDEEENKEKESERPQYGKKNEDPTKKKKPNNQGFLVFNPNYKTDANDSKEKEPISEKNRLETQKPPNNSNPEKTIENKPNDAKKPVTNTTVNNNNISDIKQEKPSDKKKNQVNNKEVIATNNLQKEEPKNKEKKPSNDNNKVEEEKNNEKLKKEEPAKNENKQNEIEEGKFLSEKLLEIPKSFTFSNSDKGKLKNYLDQILFFHNQHYISNKKDFNSIRIETLAILNHFLSFCYINKALFKNEANFSFENPAKKNQVCLLKFKEYSEEELQKNGFKKMFVDLQSHCQAVKIEISKGIISRANFWYLVQYNQKNERIAVSKQLKFFDIEKGKIKLVDGYVVFFETVIAFLKN